MLVLGYYHYSCQGVISFVFGWAKVWGRVVHGEASHAGIWPKIFFFSMLKKAWIPAFAGMTVVWREGFFLLRRDSCLFSWRPELGNWRGFKAWVTKFVSSAPFLGRFCQSLLDTKKKDFRG
jgi:hypothetical protein